MFWICGRSFWFYYIFKIAGARIGSSSCYAFRQTGTGCYQIIVWYFMVSPVATMRV